MSGRMCWRRWGSPTCGLGRRSQKDNCPAKSSITRQARPPPTFPRRKARNRILALRDLESGNVNGGRWEEHWYAIVWEFIDVMTSYVLASRFICVFPTLVVSEPVVF